MDLNMLTPHPFRCLDDIAKVLDANRGELIARLEKPDGLQGSGCRLQFGHTHFLTRFFDQSFL